MNLKRRVQLNYEIVIASRLDRYMEMFKFYTNPESAAPKKVEQQVVSDGKVIRVFDEAAALVAKADALLSLRESWRLSPATMVVVRRLQKQQQEKRNPEDEG